MNGNDLVQSLREALTHAPGNVSLRQHLADTLLNLGRAGEAEVEFRHALSLAPDNSALKIGLAHAFFRQEKKSAALVIVEDLIKRADPPAQSYILYARLLIEAGEIQRAVEHYRTGVQLDPTVADPSMAEQLGVNAAAESDVVEGRERTPWGDEPAPSGDHEIERPTIDFADVGGMDQLKEEIRMKIIFPLTNPELFKAYGKNVGGGILLYGPPGCGKTYLARATAGEVKANFLAVGISEVLDMWLGQSERNLHRLFEQARRNAPCVLFFDEVDALGASRSDTRANGARPIINQFLSELDGVKSSNDGVLILAATNAPWHLDSAFRRPGRFDRILFVPPPDGPARASILRILSRGKPAEVLDCEQIAKKTANFSGADLKAVVDVAVECKLREAMKAGALKPLTTKDLLAASATIRPSTKEWFATARNYALYSNQGGLYDDILKFLKL